MDSAARGFVENRTAKLLAILVVFVFAFVLAGTVARYGHVFRSQSIAGEFLEFPVGSPAGMLVGFSLRSVTTAALAGWLMYLMLAAAIVRSTRRGVVIGGITALIALLALNVLTVFMVAGLSSLR
jgi:hypothetical protein